MNNKKYWFPAKRYGWGWGPPSTWQGWAVLLGFAALVGAGIVVFPPQEGVGRLLAYLGLLTALLVAICWWKGEPPRWRWG